MVAKDELSLNKSDAVIVVPQVAVYRSEANWFEGERLFGVLAEKRPSFRFWKLSQRMRRLAYNWGRNRVYRVYYA